MKEVRWRENKCGRGEVEIFVHLLKTFDLPICQPGAVHLILAVPWRQRRAAQTSRSCNHHTILGRRAMDGDNVSKQHCTSSGYNPNCYWKALKYCINYIAAVLFTTATCTSDPTPQFVSLRAPICACMSNTFTVSLWILPHGCSLRWKVLVAVH